MSENGYKPFAVADIGSWFYWKKNNKNVYVIGSKSIDKYFVVMEDMHCIIFDAIKQMNGQNDTMQIRDMIIEKYHVDFDIDSLIEKLRRAGLLLNEKQILSNELDVFAKRLIGINFREIKSKARNILSVLWNILFLLSVFIVITTVIDIFLNYSGAINFVSGCMRYNDSYLYGAILAMVLSIFNIMVHECAHMLTAVRCGLQPSAFNMYLYGGFKLVWMVKIKGLYTIRRGKRILIMSAGIYSNIVLICFSILFGINDNFGLIPTEVTSKLVLNNFFMVVACCMPFNLSDGYYVMSQVTKKNNIRRHMFRLLNFSTGEYKKLDVWNTLYTVISLLMIIISFITTGVWSFKIAGEIQLKMSIYTTDVIAKLVAVIPILFIAWFDFIFIKRFILLIKSNK